MCALCMDSVSVACVVLSGILWSEFLYFYEELYCVFSQFWWFMLNPAELGVSLKKEWFCQGHFWRR